MTFDELFALPDAKLAEINPFDIARAAMDIELKKVDPEDAKSFIISPKYQVAMMTMVSSVNQELGLAMIKAMWKTLPPEHMKRATAQYSKEIRSFLQAMKEGQNNVGG